MSNFNPARWTPERQVALGLGTLIGIAVSSIVGYSLNSSVDFSFFIQHPSYYGMWPLYFIGAAIGFAVVYTLCLVSVRK